MGGVGVDLGNGPRSGGDVGHVRDGIKDHLERGRAIGDPSGEDQALEERLVLCVTVDVERSPVAIAVGTVDIQKPE